MENAEKLMTPEELARQLAMSRKFVEKHIADRRLPGMIKVGRSWRFRRDEVERRLSAASFLLDPVR